MSTRFPVRLSIFLEVDSFTMTRDGSLAASELRLAASACQNATGSGHPPPVSSST